MHEKMFQLIGIVLDWSIIRYSFVPSLLQVITTLYLLFFFLVFLHLLASFFFSNFAWYFRKPLDLWWFYSRIIWCWSYWPYFYVIHLGILVIEAIHKINGLIFLVVKENNIMRIRNVAKLSSSTIATPIKNIYNMCETSVCNFKAPFFIARQIILYWLVNIFLKNLQSHERNISDPNI